MKKSKDGLDGLKKKMTFNDWVSYFVSIGEIPTNTFFVDENGISVKLGIYPENSIEPMYLICNKGPDDYRVWSLWGKRFIRVQRNQYGRKVVYLRTTDNRTVPCLLSRLVCATFNGIPSHCSELAVQHLDEDMNNNDASNLEWTTVKVNNTREGHCKNIAIEHSGRRKKKIVLEIDSDGNTINKWPSIKAAQEATEISRSSIVISHKSQKETKVRLFHIVIEIPEAV